MVSLPVPASRSPKNLVLASVVTGLYLAVLAGLLISHWMTFRPGFGWVIGHGLVMSCLLIIPVCMLTRPQRAIRITGGVLIALIIAVQLFALIVQHVALLEIAQKVSFGLIIDNWAPLRPFIAWWHISLVPLALLAFAACVGWAQTVIWKNIPTATAGLICSAFLTLVVLLNVSVGHLERLPSDPVLALGGAPQAVINSHRVVELVREEDEARRSYVPADKKPSENIIIFVADSINPDQLSQFGYERSTLPFLDTLSEKFKSTTAQVGRSTCGDSVCGAMSILASRYFRDTPPYGAFGLGQVLRLHGYSTHFILVSDHRRFQYAHYWRFLEREADTIHDYASSPHPLNTDRIVIEGLKKLPPSDGKPKLIFVFFFSSHMSGDEEPEFARYGPFLDNKRRMKGVNEFSERDRSEIINHYDNKLTQLNDYLERSWDILEEKGYTQNSIFAFLSDHGEELASRGFFGHSSDRITEGILRIPYFLASNGPDVPDLSKITPRQFDLAPTLTDMLDIPAPSIWQGITLFDAEPEREVFHEFGVRAILKSRECYAALKRVDGSLMKYARCRHPGGSVESNFYNLEVDKLETTDLWPSLSTEERSFWENRIKDHFRLKE